MGAQKAIATYRRLYAEAAGPHMAGLYVVGSVALGDFRDGISDIDFVAVLTDPPDDAAVETLAAIHREMEVRDRNKVDGVYATAERLCSPREDDHPTPFVVDGAFQADRPCGDLNPVLRQSLVEHGLVISGPTAIALGLRADRPATARYVRGNLRSYWCPWIDMAAKAVATRRPHGDVDAAGIAWGTLGVARIAATLESGDIVSKSAAGHWAMARYPEGRASIEVALAQRRGDVTRASLDIAEEALAFMRSIVSRCAF